MRVTTRMIIIMEQKKLEFSSFFSGYYLANWQSQYWDILDSGFSGEISFKNVLAGSLDCF